MQCSFISRAPPSSIFLSTLNQILFLVSSANPNSCSFAACSVNTSKPKEPGNCACVHEEKTLTMVQACQQHQEEKVQRARGPLPRSCHSSSSTWTLCGIASMLCPICFLTILLQNCNHQFCRELSS